MAPRPLLISAAFLAALILPAPASAKIVEVGRTDAAPACPASPCLAVSRTTGYQIKVADERGSFVVPEDGKIVAWTIALGKPTTEQIAFFDKGLGGPASARITVLRPGKTQRVNLSGYKTPIFDIRLVNENDDRYTFWKVNVSEPKRNMRRFWKTVSFQTLVNSGGKPPADGITMASSVSFQVTAATTSAGVGKTSNF